MDNSSTTAPANPVEPQVSNINASPMPPQTPPANAPKKGMGKSMLLVAAFILLIGLVVAGILYLYLAKSPQTYNASVYTPPKTQATSPSPTPTGTGINQNDNSNNALNSDSSLIDKDVNSASSDLDGVNQSFNDQQTNLQ